MASRNATAEDRSVAHARLVGLGAWNGQGLLSHLAETSSRDPSRKWMEPLRDLCLRVRESVDSGKFIKLSASEASSLDELQSYALTFASALE